MFQAKRTASVKMLLLNGHVERNKIEREEDVMQMQHDLGQVNKYDIHLD